MFTCAKIRHGGTYLKNHLTVNDYYCEGEHVVGGWIGEGAKILEIYGDKINATDAVFESLRLNRNPNNPKEKLTPRRVNDNERSVRFFDFQCSAQKSVSIMAVVMGDKRLYEAHDRATTKAFAELERFAAFQTGSAENRTQEISGNVIAAAFRHDASRALDPQIHTHFVIANATWDAENKRWLSLDTCEMFRAIRYAGKVYQNELALECRRLGYQIESIRNSKGVVEGFEITGVSEDIRERYSKRRAEVEVGIARFEREIGRTPSVAEINVIARETRSGKLKEITTAEVRAGQLSQLTYDEKAVLEAVKQRAVGNECVHMGSAWQALKKAKEHIFERESVTRGHKALAEALNWNLGCLNLDKLRECMTSAKNGLVQLTKHIKNPLLSSQWTSTRNLHLERWAVAFVNQTRGICNPLGKTENVAFDFKSAEQRRVVLETLNNRDQVYAIRGRAGTGKTTCLAEIRKGLENRKVYYLAPTASAVEKLREDGFTNAKTVDSFLVNPPTDLSDAVVIVDESSLKSTEMGTKVMNAACCARLLLVGDTRQHVSVEAGDFLRVLEKHSKLNSSELKDIRRQETPEYNAAVRTLSDGKAVEGMKQLDALGWIENAKGAYLEHAADEYIARTEEGTNLNQCIAISPTWREIHIFTDAIRDRLKKRELLADGERIKVYNRLDWTRAQRSDTGNYKPGMFLTFNTDMSGIRREQTLEVEKVKKGELWVKERSTPINAETAAGKFAVSEAREIELSIGDRILIRRNHYDTDLVNGNLLTVEKINHDGSIETREGKKIPADFRHFTHGYVVTSHKSQSASIKYEVVASEKLDAVAAYVALSRGKVSARVFTPDKENLFDKLVKPTDRHAALDVLNKERNRFLHQDADEHFRRNIKNPLTKAALQYASYANYNIGYNGDYEKDFQTNDCQVKNDDFQTRNDFQPASVYEIVN